MLGVKYHSVLMRSGRVLNEAETSTPGNVGCNVINLLMAAGACSDDLRVRIRDDCARPFFSLALGIQKFIPATMAAWQCVDMLVLVLS